MKRKTIIEIIACLFILLFVYTATSKLLDFRRFEAVLSNSPAITRTKAPYVAWTLPFAELIIAGLLFVPRSRRLGLWASLLIMTLFTGYIFYMLYFSRGLPCNCGGVLKQMTWPQHLVFNIFFTLLAGLGLLLDKRGHSPITHVTYTATA